jgi:hypothetical protein
MILRSLLLLTALALQLPAGDELHFRQSAFSSDSPGWTVWSDRAETLPRTWVETTVSLGEPGSLSVSGNGNIGAFGGWERILPGIEAGAWYRLTVHYRATGVTSENWQIQPRLDWRQSDGRRAGEVDYAYQATRDGDWKRITLLTQAPDGARSVALQLFLAHAPQATVWWDDISFERVPPPGPRRVTIASINLRPQNTRSAEKSVQQFLATSERVIPAHTDLVLLPEGITVIGTGKHYADVAETIPGPTTRVLANSRANIKPTSPPVSMSARAPWSITPPCCWTARATSPGSIGKSISPAPKWSRWRPAMTIRFSKPTSESSAL